MAIFRPLAARSPQRPPGQARRNKVLADSADDPDDADKPDGLDVQSESALPFVSTILNFTISNKQWIGSAVCVKIL